jgi:hypothetical protein
MMIADEAASLVSRALGLDGKCQKFKAPGMTNNNVRASETSVMIASDVRASGTSDVETELGVVHNPQEETIDQMASCLSVWGKQFSAHQSRCRLLAPFFLTCIEGLIPSLLGLSFSLGVSSAKS